MTKVLTKINEINYYINILINDKYILTQAN